MEYDHIQLSEQFLQEAFGIGLVADDIFEMIERKHHQDRIERNIIDSTPAYRAVLSYKENAKKPKPLGTGLSDLSFEVYSRIIERFYEFCKEQGGTELEVHEMLQYVTSFLVETDAVRQFKPSTWNKYVAVLRSFIHETAKRYKIKKYHLPEFRSKQHPFPQALSAQEIKELLQHARSGQYGLRNLFFFGFFLCTGARRDEFRLLQLRNIDMVAGEVRLHGKGDKYRKLSFTKRLIPLLKTYCEVYGITSPDHYLCCPTDDPSHPLRSSTLDDIAQRVLSKLPNYKKGDELFGYHIHSLRHTYAVTLLLSNVPIRVISQALGHTSVITTQGYTVLDTHGLRRALEPALQTMGQWWKGIVE